MKFPRLLLLFLFSGASVHSFVPQQFAQDLVRNAVFRKPAFMDTVTATPPQVSNLLDNLPDALRQISLPSPDGLVKDVVAFFEKATASLQESCQTLIATLQEALESANLPTEVLQEFVDKVNTALSAFVTSHPEIQSLYNTFQQQLQKLPVQLDNLPPGIVIALSAIVSFTVISSLLSFGQEPPPSQPYPTGRYNATSARAYFDDHVLDVIQRGLQVATTSLGFGISILSDYVKYVITTMLVCRAVV